jgi:hypothetical protein
MAQRIVSDDYAQVVTMKNINEHIASVMKSVLMPQSGEKFDFTDIIDLACMPQFKLLQASTNPCVSNGKAFSSSGEKTWHDIIDGCLEYLDHSPPSSSIQEQVVLACDDKAVLRANLSHQTIFCKGYLKGFDAVKHLGQPDSITYQKLAQRLVSKQHPVSWNPLADCVTLRAISERPYSHKIFTTKAPSLNVMGATVLTNNTQLCNQLEKMINTSTQKIKHKAYLQHYIKFGVEEDYIAQKIEEVRDIKDNYVSVLY